MTDPAHTDGRTKHGELLLLVPIKKEAGAETSLEDVLRAIAHPPDGRDFEENVTIPFGRLTRVHFVRLLILPEQPGPPAPKGQTAPKSPVPAQLAFGIDFDGPLRECLEEFVDVAADGLDQVFGHCDGWTPLAPLERAGRYQAVNDFASRHAVKANTFYTGTMNRSVLQIRREALLRDAIEAFLDDQVGRSDVKDAVGLHARVREWAFKEPGFEWLEHRPGPMPVSLVPTTAKAQATTVLAILATVVLVTWGISRFVPLTWVGIVLGALGVLGFAGYCYLYHLSTVDPVIIGADEEHTRALVVLEDQVFQNQITTLNYIKRPLWFRRLVLRLVLALVNVAARVIENQGTLSGIPSIHFARWVVIDEGRRLLFFSNFDGTWESYLGDFVDKAHTGLTRIWSNVVGFPRTRGLGGEGALDEQRFKAIARDSQIPTQVWYSAYKTLTVSNINDNSRLRHGLYVDMKEDAAREWLRMATPRARPPRANEPPPIRAQRVEVADVQGLVARSYRDLHYAAYLPLAFADGMAARHWLEEIVPRITPASLDSEAVKRLGSALNVAFTHSGLEKLGLSRNAVAGFSREFSEGMAGHDHRQRLLGDTGKATPSEWAWGGPRNPTIDAMLFVFAADQAGLDDLACLERARAAAHGVHSLGPLATNWLDRKEHFGFDDGIANPRIAGLVDESQKPGETDIIPAGELVLGYVNAYQRLPMSPTVDDDPRSRRHLPKAPADLAGLARPRDFGRNGSYVVMRQLEQNVKMFWEEVDRRAGGDARGRTLLAAKMVGRWPNGAPLTLHKDREPQSKAAREENGFFYEHDLHGEMCPIGAHIRRTNPRDSLHPDPQESLKVSGRHRLVRRGRSYGDPVSEDFSPEAILKTRDDRASTGTTPVRGLHFICFNSDIGRQFEFVQSAWMNNPKFGGLYCDPDPMVSPRPTTLDGRPEPNVFTMQGCPVRTRERDVPEFVRTVGGSYLFMPGIRALQYLADTKR
jgi:Dyp-type peroxidase family